MVLLRVIRSSLWILFDQYANGKCLTSSHSVFPLRSEEYFKGRWAVFSSHKTLTLRPCNSMKSAWSSSSKFSQLIARMCHTRGKYGLLLHFDQAVGQTAVAAKSRQPCVLCINVEPVHKKRKIKGLLKIKDWADDVHELCKVLSIMDDSLVKDLALKQNAG